MYTDVLVKLNKFAQLINLFLKADKTYKAMSQDEARNFMLKVKKAYDRDAAKKEGVVYSTDKQFFIEWTKPKLIEALGDEYSNNEPLGVQLDMTMFKAKKALNPQWKESPEKIEKELEKVWSSWSKLPKPEEKVIEDLKGRLRAACKNMLELSTHFHALKAKDRPEQNLKLADLIQEAMKAVRYKNKLQHLGFSSRDIPWDKTMLNREAELFIEKSALEEEQTGQKIEPSKLFNHVKMVLD